MNDVPAVNHKIKALELANQHNAEPAEVVKRATVYHAFLSGSAAPAAGAATAGATGANKTPPAGGAADKTAADKAAAKTAADKAAAKVAADKAAAKAAADKANTAKTPAAGNKTPAAGASGAPVPPDTKAPGGKNTYADVVEALRKVRDKSSKDDAIAIMVEDGGGAKSVRDLKPALYDAVVEACDNVLNGDGGAAGGEATGQVEDPTAQPERDELGL